MRKLTLEHRANIKKSMKNIDMSEKAKNSWSDDRRKQYSLNKGKEVINNLSGKRFGTLIAIEPIKLYDGRWFWRCKCDCGNYRNVRTTYLTTGRVVTCELEAKQNANSKYRSKPKGEATWNSYYAKYKKDAAHRNIPFNLSKEEFRQMVSKNCHCGDEPKLINYSKKSLNPEWGIIYANGVDRLDSDLGYCSSNCVSSCWPCNSAKNDMSVNEFRMWIKKTYEHMLLEGKLNEL